MRYSELIQFDPIDTVVQLRGADNVDTAARLVSTYVISQHMAERLTGVVIPHLQFDEATDQKALLVVGNYGTGKSHLLAVLSAIAERADLSEQLRDETVREQAASIAGKFKVIRAEIGATQMALRDIIIAEIEDALDGWGIDYRFPTMTEASNTKDPINEMMARFQERFPEHGLLIVVDELLDYLRSRRGEQFILDIGFLREIGEVCETTRVRFIGGVQESLFDSPTFAFVASELGRVKDRFAQIQIAREDVAFVVAERLLRKSSEQRARVRAYLEPFTSLYPDMLERLDRYVQLFPVHPAYIATFESIHVVEKREVLRTLSQAMRDLLDHEVPTDAPGLVAYDSYWDVLRSNPAYRALPDVRRVIDVSGTLEEKVEALITRRQYLPMARRIINALSVQRLTVSDLKAPIGVTPEQLRDDLCLYVQLPERDADFLKTTVETTLHEISRSVSGSFISRNPDSGQWYLDLEKITDYDAIIADKATTLSDDQLNQAYYDVLARLMEVVEVSSHVPGHRIWSYQIAWRDKRVTRPGYLFFGAPNQRSTAQPPREFYLYFLQPYDPPAFDDTRQADEIFFRLVRRDAQFDEWLRLYAAATLLAATAGGEAASYRDKASSTSPQRPGYLQRLVRWLQENAATNIDVTYRGVACPAVELVQGRVESFRDLVDQVASSSLAPQFAELHPDYPTFGITITRENRAQAAQEGIKAIVGPLRSQQGIAVLTALELLQGDKLEVEHSRYARYLRDELRARGEGKVLNRADLIESLYSSQIEFDKCFHLEPEWLAVVLVALVHAGAITVQVPGLRIDAGNIDQATRIPLDRLTGFQHIARPRGMDLDPLKALFELLGLAPGLILDPNQHTEAVQHLQQRVGQELERVVALEQRVAGGVPIWNANVIEGTEQADLAAQLSRYRGFLDTLAPLDTPGKLRNFRQTTDEVRAYVPTIQALRMLERLGELVAELQPLAAYLLQARAALPAEDELVTRIDDLEQRQLDALRDPATRGTPLTRDTLQQDAKALKQAYITEYMARHNRARLNITDDDRRKRLQGSDVVRRLRALRLITVLPTATLRDVEQQMADLRACTGVTPADLATSPLCPPCKFRPDEQRADEPAAERLAALEERFDQLEQEWTATLVENLQDPTVATTRALLAPGQQAQLDEFVRLRQLPGSVGESFLKALAAAFDELERVVVTRDELLGALANSGAPSTVTELSERLAKYLEQRTRGMDASRVRIVVE